MGSLKNIVFNFIRPRNTKVIFLKILHHWRHENSDSALLWAKENVQSTDRYFQNLDKELWRESILAADEITSHGKSILSEIELDLGGGGAYPILYFYTRHIGARNIVETGVAAGWSSLSMLMAIEKNDNNGMLFSTDFPLFRFSNPENIIGVLVPEKFKKNWRLDIRGDDFALPLFVREAEKIDIFHYDSEKSYRGRHKAWNLVAAFLSENAVVMFDDIQNNFHFRDLVQKLKTDFCVFEFQGKYIGLFHWDTRVLSESDMKSRKFPD